MTGSYSSVTLDLPLHRSDNVLSSRSHSPVLRQVTGSLSPSNVRSKLQFKVQTVPRGTMSDSEHASGETLIKSGTTSGEQLISEKSQDVKLLLPLIVVPLCLA